MQQPRFDVTDHRDVACLVNVFYDRVRDDRLLGPIIDDVAHVDWMTHLPDVRFLGVRALRHLDVQGHTARRTSGTRETYATDGRGVRSLGHSFSDNRR